uniref:Uncharacterized protein n=1 Tax=Steinernema glaseri TaxID=37863 RepID=A0A1I7Y3L4_9BILA
MGNYQITGKTLHTLDDLQNLFVLPHDLDGKERVLYPPLSRSCHRRLSPDLSECNVVIPRKPKLEPPPSRKSALGPLVPRLTHWSLAFGLGFLESRRVRQSALHSATARPISNYPLEQECKKRDIVRGSIISVAASQHEISVPLGRRIWFPIPCFPGTESRSPPATQASCFERRRIWGDQDGRLAGSLEKYSKHVIGFLSSVLERDGKNGSCCRA